MKRRIILSQLEFKGGESPAALTFSTNTPIYDNGKEEIWILEQVNASFDANERFLQTQYGFDIRMQQRKKISTSMQ